jgi:hypothetical protein
MLSVAFWVKRSAENSKGKIECNRFLKLFLVPGAKRFLTPEFFAEFALATPKMVLSGGKKTS